GYVLKSAPVSELVGAIDAVAQGNGYLCPATAGKLVEHLRGADEEPPPELTPREREVLQLVVEGRSNKETAERLGISPKTVEVHRANIASKLGIYDLPGLVRYAIRKGTIKP